MEVSWTTLCQLEGRLDGFELTFKLGNSFFFLSEEMTENSLVFMNAEEISCLLQRESYQQVLDQDRRILLILSTYWGDMATREHLSWVNNETQVVVQRIAALKLKSRINEILNSFTEWTILLVHLSLIDWFFESSEFLDEVLLECSENSFELRSSDAVLTYVIAIRLIRFLD